jgi:hypothetical protein
LTLFTIWPRGRSGRPLAARLSAHGRETAHSSPIQHGECRLQLFEKQGSEDSLQKELENDQQISRYGPRRSHCARARRRLRAAGGAGGHGLDDQHGSFDGWTYGVASRPPAAQGPYGRASGAGLGPSHAQDENGSRRSAKELIGSNLLPTGARNETVVAGGPGVAAPFALVALPQADSEDRGRYTRQYLRAPLDRLT